MIRSSGPDCFLGLLALTRTRVLYKSCSMPVSGGRSSWDRKEEWAQVPSTSSLGSSQLSCCITDTTDDPTAPQRAWLPLKYLKQQELVFREGWGGADPSVHPPLPARGSSAPTGLLLSSQQCPDWWWCLEKGGNVNIQLLRPTWVMLVWLVMCHTR